MFRKEKLQLKKRKNAALKVLLLSAFVTFMCFSMLVGTTYAWLTDSVTSAKNTVLAGSLDIELNYYNDGGSWVSADGDVFADVVWQPGRLYYRAVEIKNNGSVPINYAFKANVPSEYGSVNTLGEQFYISDSMKVLQETYDTASGAISAMQGAGTRVDSVRDFGFGGFTQLTGRLDADSSAYVLLTINMPETNVENSTTKSGMPAPKFDVQLVVTAVQAGSQDSFGTTAGATPPSAAIESTQYPLAAGKLLYNKDGAYIIENADDFARFASAVNKGETFTGDTVKLMSDIDLGGAAWPLTGAFAGTFDGNGKTISSFEVSATGAGEIKLLGDHASNVVLADITYTNTTDYTYAVGEGNAIITVAVVAP